MGRPYEKPTPVNQVSVKPNDLINVATSDFGVDYIGDTYTIKKIEKIAKAFIHNKSERMISDISE